MIAAVGAVVAAFLIGSIPFGVVISRLFFRRDLRSEGSGNIGAANALRTLGKRGAIAVLVLDALKGAAGVWLGAAAAGPWGACAGGLAAVIAHCYTPFLGFRGGKGVATSLGALFALAWTAGAAFAVAWLVVVAASGYSSLGSILGSFVAVPFVWYAAGAPGFVYGVVAAGIVLAKHRQNLARLSAGTESVLPLFGRGERKVQGPPSPLG